jgi:hypothetical protein
MQCTVQFIITLFNVSKVLLCVIYQLSLTVFACYTNNMFYVQRSLLSAVSHSRGRTWNVLTVDTGALLYCFPILSSLSMTQLILLDLITTAERTVSAAVSHIA